MKLHHINDHIKGTPKSGRHWRGAIPTKRHVGQPIITICPPCPPDARFHVKPDEVGEGGGFAAAGVGIDPLTGKPWEPRA